MIFRFGYHNSATVKGGAAVAQRLKALEGENENTLFVFAFSFAFLPPNPKPTALHEKMLFAMLKLR